MSVHKELPESTLIIGRFSSECNNCGRQVLPDSETHEEISGWGGPAPGCGVRFTHVTTEYVGTGIDEASMAMRPDLTWIPITGVLAG